MMKVYVQAASKKEINARLTLNQTVQGLEYGLNGSCPRVLNEVADGTVVSIYSKIVMGNPYAKAYGTMATNKFGQRVLK